jgi:hypothetical protein
LLDGFGRFCEGLSMDTEEREIFQFLKVWGGNFINAREIARRAGSKRKFHENPDWAKAILLRMEERDILESNSKGHFRIKPVAKQKWAAPTPEADGSQILQESGVAVEEDAAVAVAADEYYEKL